MSFFCVDLSLDVIGEMIENRLCIADWIAMSERVNHETRVSDLQCFKS